MLSSHENVDQNIIFVGHYIVSLGGNLDGPYFILHYTRVTLHNVILVFLF